MSAPAVVTEALYALAVRSRPPVVPDEIYLISTSATAEQIRRELLGPRGRIRSLARDYGLPARKLHCSPGQLVVLRDMRGRPLKDVRTTADSRAVGRQILALILDIRKDPTVVLHCSIAGGRKTMGALLAMALQVAGGSRDRLYHVLVEVPEFFYPPPAPTILEVAGRRVRADRARVELAEIPLVRLGDSLALLDLDRGDLGMRARTAERLIAGPQTLPRLRIDLDSREVSVGRWRTRFPAQELALYALYAWLRRQCGACGASGRSGCAACHVTDLEVFERWRGAIETFYAQARPGSTRPFAGWRRHRKAAEVSPRAFCEWLRQTRSRIKRRLEVLGPWLARYGVAPLAQGARPARRGIKVAPSAIEIRPANGRPG